MKRTAMKSRARVRVGEHGADRSDKIRQSARGEECQVRLEGICSYDAEKTIWSHYRGSAGGKGLGLKSSDICGTYACTNCDAAYDGQFQRPEGMTKLYVNVSWFQGHMRSLCKLIEKGLI